MDQNLIVIAEDDRDLRHLLSVSLENAGYQTVGARDGATAARLLTTARPAGLITDVRMPDLNGFDLCRLTRRTPATRDIAILMFSAGTHPYDIQAGFDAGADRYLPKPLSPRRILAELDETLASRRAPLPLSSLPLPSLENQITGVGRILTLSAT